MERLPESCTDVLASLPLFVGGDLDEPVMGAVAGHLVDCPECRAQCERAQRARAVLVDRSALESDPAKTSAPDLWAGVRRQLQIDGILAPAGSSGKRPEPVASPVTPARPTRGPRLWTRTLVAAAAVVICVPLAQRLLSGGDSAPVQPVNNPLVQSEEPPAPEAPGAPLPGASSPAVSASSTGAASVAPLDPRLAESDSEAPDSPDSKGPSPMQRVDLQAPLLESRPGGPILRPLPRQSSGARPASSGRPGRRRLH